MASQFKNAADVVIAKAISSAMPMQLAKNIENASPNVTKTSPPGSWKPLGAGTSVAAAAMTAKGDFGGPVRSSNHEMRADYNG